MSRLTNRLVRAIATYSQSWRLLGGSARSLRISRAKAILRTAYNTSYGRDVPAERLENRVALCPLPSALSPPKCEYSTGHDITCLALP
ncbi:MAG: hypothetical protein RH949_06055 [Coleofasciculus sp. A1-SPW-01]|uniref:hypothetical protein n=1 Tax=Coleofasciculus sp. A1-SPW-01 TaxID=3070819 RepID=UPI0032F2D595